MANLETTKKTWAITTFFNSQRYKNKIVNFHKFKKGLKEQGVPLLVVECAFGDHDFELNKDEADILVQVRSNSVLWQKERLLNIALKNLPADCENIVWVDADIIFLNNNWVSETEKLLEQYPIVQPFATSFRLGRWESIKNAVKNSLTPDRIRSGFAFYYNQLEDKSIIYAEEKDFVYVTDGGFAWAAKRNIFDDCGFYDLGIVGGADWVMNGVFFGMPNGNPWIQDWMNNVQKFVKGNIYFTSGQIIHLYHGSIINRRYEGRSLILSRNHYDPKRDLCLNNDGCWEWSDKAPESLKKEVALYFQKRNEDGTSFNSFSKKYILENIGQVGIFIKSISPKLYNFLKKLK